MTRTRSWLAAVVAVSAGTMFSACDQPTDPGFDQIDVSPAALASSVSCAAAFGGNPSRTLTVNVKLSNNAAGEGVLVTLVSPTTGPACEAETSSAGVATFTGIRQGSQFIVLVRDEVNGDASKLQIVPPHTGINNSLVNLVADAPSINTTHQRPTLVSGSNCSSVQELTWASYTTAFGSACSMSNGLTINLTLGSTTGITGTLIGLPAGTDKSKVIVAGLSPWAGGTKTQQQAACDLLQWLSTDRKTECGDPDQSNGPAVLQALGRANASGQFKLGAIGNPVVIETVLGENGFTFFGTAVATAAGSYQVYVVPGMCRVEDSTTTEDETNPGGTPTLDILRTFSTIGLRTTGDATFMGLAAVPSTAIVGAIIEATSANKGEFTMSYRLSTGGGTRSVKASFTIDPAGACEMADGSGSGLGNVDGSTVSYVGTCFKGADGNFKLAFVLTGLPESVDRSTMAYTLKAGRDNIDAARYFLYKGAIPYEGQGDTECPVPTNNDGRYDAGV